MILGGDPPVWQLEAIVAESAKRIRTGRVQHAELGGLVASGWHPGDFRDLWAATREHSAEHVDSRHHLGIEPRRDRYPLAAIAKRCDAIDLDDELFRLSGSKLNNSMLKRHRRRIGLTSPVLPKLTSSE